LAERLRVAGGEEAVAALAPGRVLDPLARERLCHLARGLVGGEDERHVAPEDTLEDGADERVVRAAEDDGVDAGVPQRRRVAAHRLGQLLERRVGLDQRHQPGARDPDEARPRVERAHELLVAARGDGELGGEQADAAVPRRLYGGVRLGDDDGHDRHVEALLQVGERRGRRRVAGDDEQLHVPAGEVGTDLVREAAHVGERLRPVRQPRVVAEVDDVLVRERDEALVQDGEAAHAGVEHADRAPVHPADRTAGAGSLPYPPVRRPIWLAAAAAALALAGNASAFSRQDTTVTMADGTAIAATLWLPAGSPPPGGWPAIVLFHGLGGSREDMNALAEQAFLPGDRFAVLAYDARGHGHSGGLIGVDGPNEVSDARAMFAWLRDRPDVSDTQIGAFGISYGGGAVWSSLAAGVPWAA